MTKTLALTMTLALALAGIAAATPAQAATRLVDISADRLADRCGDHGGAFSLQSDLAVCQTETVAVQCTFVTSFQAACEWAGVDNQINVNRLIGMTSEGQISQTGAGSLPGQAGNGKGGGFNGPKDFKMAP